MDKFFVKSSVGASLTKKSSTFGASISVKMQSPLKENGKANGKHQILMHSQKTSHQLGLHDDHLLKILESQFDQPLNDNIHNHNYQRIDDAGTPPQRATSPFYSNNVSDENMPPPNFISSSSTNSNCTQRHIEDLTLLRRLSNMSVNKDKPDIDCSAGAGNLMCTPPNSTEIGKKDNPYLARLRRDLNSPSASTRLRALKALRTFRASQNGNYCNFDIPYEEQDIITDEERLAINQQPKTIQEVMKNVVVYVEVRSGADNRSDGIKKVISELGAQVNDKLLRNTTHVIFKDGLLSTYNKAKIWNIPIVSILWIEACKKSVRLADPKRFAISNIERYENPELFRKIRKQKSMQPNAEDKIRIRKPKPMINAEGKNETVTEDFANIEIPKPKDNLPEIFGDFLDKLLANTENSSDCFSKNSELLKIIQSSNFSNVKLQSPTARSLISNSKAIDKSTEEIIDLTPTSSHIYSTENNSNKEEVINNSVSDSDKVTSTNRRTSRRLSFQKPLNYSEIDVDFSMNMPITPSKQNKKRRRTIFTPSSMHSTIIENGEMNNSTRVSTNMEISQINVTSTVTSTKTNRRPTMHTPKMMDETATQSNVSDKQQNKANAKTPVKKDATKETELMSSQEDSDFEGPSHIKTPKQASNKKPGLLKSQMKASNSARKISPMVKSLLRRRTMQFSNSQEFGQKKLDVSSSINTNSSNEQFKNLRRSLFTPNKAIEFDKNNQLKEIDQLLTNDSICEPVELSQHFTSTNNIDPKDLTLSPFSLNKTGTLLEEYNNSLTFSSSKMPKSAKRRTIYDISMDIIDQRLQNINKNVRLNRSVSESDIIEDTDAPLNDSLTKSTPQLPINSKQSPKLQFTNTIQSESKIQSTCMPATTARAGTKRKLFAPPSLFGMSSSLTDLNDESIGNNNPTSKSISTKRNREVKNSILNDIPKPKKCRLSHSIVQTPTKLQVQTNKASQNLKAKVIRRSTMDFQTPPAKKVASNVPMKPLSEQKPASRPCLVYTNMHREEEQVIREVGKF